MTARLTRFRDIPDGGEYGDEPGFRFKVVEHLKTVPYVAVKHLHSGCVLLVPADAETWYDADEADNDR